MNGRISDLKRWVSVQASLSALTWAGLASKTHLSTTSSAAATVTDCSLLPLHSGGSVWGGERQRLSICVTVMLSGTWKKASLLYRELCKQVIDSQTFQVQTTNLFYAQREEYLNTYNPIPSCRGPPSLSLNSKYYRLEFKKI